MKNFKFKIVSCISIAALLIGGATKVNAQDDSNKKVEFGFRLMPTFTSLDVKTSSGGAVSGDVVLGFGVGALLGINITKNFGIQTELIYSSISQKTKYNNVEQKINLRYVNIPVLLSLNTGKYKVINFNVVAGPQIGFNVGSKITISGSNDASDPQPVLSVKKQDFGFAYGVGIDFALNSIRTVRLGFGYRGVYGLIDVSDNSNSFTTDSYYVLDRTKVKTNSIYTGLSILF